MRKYILRIGGMLMIAGSLIAVAPARQAGAQTTTPCACFTMCIFGKHCCPVVVNGQCTNECLPVGQACP
jgi:hypothetical protein